MFRVTRRACGSDRRPNRSGVTNEISNCEEMKMSKSRLLTVLAAAIALSVPALHANAQAPAKLKVGFMLPYTGTFAALGTAIENGFRLYVNEQGGKLGGREIEYVKVDDESEPSKAADNVNKLIKRDNVDVVVGHRALRRRHGDGQGCKGERHAADRSECRCPGSHRGDVFAKHLPLVVLELAARLCDGRRRGREGIQESRHHHVEIRGG
jgi:hypothetical protein